MSPVVIAGAGPNGLMLACELALAGIHPVVLDVLDGPSQEPKANGLVGQVVRMLDQRGLYAVLSGQGGSPQPSPAWIFAGMMLDFAGLQDNPMYAIRISQPQLVEHLVQRAAALGVQVRWGHALTGLRAGPHGVQVDVDAPGGSYTLAAEYLVGADGGRSLVRKTVGIEFAGATSPTVTRISHVHIPEALHGADGGLEIPGFGPIRFGHNRFDRGLVIYAQFEPGDALVGTLEYGTADDSVPMSRDDLSASLRRILGVDLPFEEPRGPGPHALRRIVGQNTRQATRYREGRVLLLGDAAHVHSAMGGPGLNLGLQDALNLGWKLAAELTGWAPEGLLDTYHGERHPVGERVMMHSMAQLALVAPGAEVGALRTLFAELLAVPGADAHMAGLLSGADVRYDVGNDHPLAGRLHPEVTLDDGRRSAELLHAGRPVLLDLADGSFAAAARDWQPRVEVVVARAVRSPAAAMLIRPDGYIAWAADTSGETSAVELRGALHRWFGAPLSPA